MVDKIITVFEKASGCKVHKDVTQDKWKVLLLGGWRRLQQNDIPVPYIKIADHLDMLGIILMETYNKTRKSNGEETERKLRLKLGPWRDGRFMPLVERSHSLNTYALTKIWYKAHTIEYRVSDINSFNKQAYSWLYADQLCKPQDHVKFRTKDQGGLGLHNVKCKSMAILLKAFLETACVKSEFQVNLYHQALLKWHVYGEHDIPNPGSTPYYSKSFFNTIRSAVESINQSINQSIVSEPDEVGIYQIKPCGTELLSPLNDWQLS